MRYGVDFEVLAFNSFGDQTAAGIERVFGGQEVTVSASYTSYPMLVDGRTVPGLSVTPIRGESGPTLLEGEPVRHDDEVVLGVDTADRLDVDPVTGCRCNPAGPTPVVRRPRRCPCASSGSRRSPPSRNRAPTRRGSVSARSSPGRPSNSCSAPTKTCPSGPPRAWRRAPTRQSSSTANPDGVEDALGVQTRWFTDARPAELLQLDEASPVLAGAIAVALLLLVAVVAQGAWSRTRAINAELSVLQALGCSRAQLARTAAWQPVPPGLAALVIGVPLGIAVGRLAFSAFARSIAVVDDPSSPPWLVVALALAVAASVGAGALVAGQVRAPRRERRHPARRRSPPRLTPSANSGPKSAGTDRLRTRVGSTGRTSGANLATSEIRGDQVDPRLARQRRRVEAGEELGHRHWLTRLRRA